MRLHYSQNLMTTTWGHPFSSNVSNARELNFIQLSSVTHKLIKVSYNSNIKLSHHDLSFDSHDKGILLMQNVPVLLYSTQQSISPLIVPPNLFS
jgi:hypothetical protein